MMFISFIMPFTLSYCVYFSFNSSNTYSHLCEAFNRLFEVNVCVCAMDACIINTTISTIPNMFGFNILLMLNTWWKDKPRPNMTARWHVMHSISMQNAMNSLFTKLVELWLRFLLGDQMWNILSIQIWIIRLQNNMRKSNSSNGARF